MQEPDDFGFSPLRTLARVADPTPAAGHSPFWTAWWKEVVSGHPEIRPRREADPSDPTCDREFESTRATRIGCRLLLPPGGPDAVRAGLVTSHGYGEAGALAERDGMWRTLVGRGVAVLLVRIRGYAGSRLDCGDLTALDRGLGWICRGLAAPTTGEGSHPDRPTDVLNWVLPHGVADVVNACRALSAWLRERADRRLRIYLHGESFGAGLAAIAAAQLAQHAGEEGGAPARLVLGVPTFGDWPWRLTQRYGGSGGEVAELIRRRPDLEYVIGERLRLLDAVVHARRVACDTLCKLAERDDIVPAPAAAAVFNALGTDPGRRWRFVTPYGHFDGGLAHQRREVLFQRCLEDFLDPALDPAEAMAPWEPSLAGGERLPEAVRARRAAAGPEAVRNAEPDPAAGALSDAGSGASAIAAERPVAVAEHDPRRSGGQAGPDEQPGLFGAEPLLDLPEGDGDERRPIGVDALLVEQYVRAGRTLDDLPYTPEFEVLARAVRAADPDATDRSIFHRLHNLRKAGRLPRLGRAASQPPAISGEEEQRLAALVVEKVGRLGARDRLPYTPEFGELLDAFNAESGRNLHPHDVWRLIAKLAK